MAVIVSNQQRRRRAKSRMLQRPLVTVVAAVVCLLIVAVVLYQMDSALFHTKTMAKHFKKKPELPRYLSPESLVAITTKNNVNILNNNNAAAADHKNLRQQRNEEKNQNSEEASVGEIVAKGANDATLPSQRRRRRVALDLQAVSGGGAAEVADVGTVVVETVCDWAPLGVQRFWELVEADFFTHVKFFRVLPMFVAQFGIASDPTVQARWKSRTILDDPVLHTNAAYTVTFAMSGQNSRTTQLFINLVDNARLDAEGFAPIGSIVQGTEYLTKIYDGYWEQPNQGQIVQRGNAYLDQEFPMLTYISAVRILDD